MAQWPCSSAQSNTFCCSLSPKMHHFSKFKYLLPTPFHYLKPPCRNRESSCKKCKMQGLSPIFILFLLTFSSAVYTSAGGRGNPGKSAAVNANPTGASGSGHGPNWDYNWGWGSGPGTGWGYGSGSGMSPSGFGRGFGYGFGVGTGSGSGSGYGWGSGGARGGGYGRGSGGDSGGHGVNSHG